MRKAKPILRVGTLGAARITIEALVKPASEIQSVRLAGVAARDHKRAVVFAREYGIERVFDSYQAMLEDPDIDAIYNPLPNSLHCEWTIKALQAGKHVLCEKPFCNNADEARQMVRAAQETGQILMEAFHYRYHPLMARVREILPALGPLQHIESKFCIALYRFGDIRYSYKLGGGATMDVGAYTSDILLQLASASGDPGLAATPRVTHACASLFRPEVDRAMEAQLLWENGTSGRIINSIWSLRVPGMYLRVTGKYGQIHVSNLVTPHHGHRLKFKIDNKSDQEQLPGKSTYYYQLLEFERRIREQSGSSDLHESIATMELIDAIYTAAGLSPRGH